MSTIRPVGTKMKCFQCGFDWENKCKTIKKCPECRSKEFAHPIVTNLAGEEWRVSSLYPMYEVSNCGRVRNIKKRKGTHVGRLMKNSINHDGYARIKRIFAHVLVAHEFLGEKPEGYECNHIDGNKLNNNVSNLEYTTHKDNMQHAKRSGLMAAGEKAGNSKLKKSDIYNILNMKRSGVNHPTLAKLFNVDQSTISLIVNGLAWKKEFAEYAIQIS
jgi:hypothetical protein